MRAVPGGRLVVALAASLAALAGVLATLALGGGESREVRTITVTTAADPAQELIARGPVPDVVGEQLDAAKSRVRQLGFVAQVDGAGIPGVLAPSEWKVTGQEPAGGRQLDVGGTVRLRVERG